MIHYLFGPNGLFGCVVFQLFGLMVEYSVSKVFYLFCPLDSVYGPS